MNYCYGSITGYETLGRTVPKDGYGRNGVEVLKQFWNERETETYNKRYTY
jgi:hypothetical protein